MSKASRGGHTLKTGKIGYVNCLRQQMLMPGERMNMGIQGSCRLESLRERDVMRINAHLAVFMTPLRWVWPEYPDYVKEGPATIKTCPAQLFYDYSAIGLGAWKGDSGTPGAGVHSHWVKACDRIYNEWYKWPEDPDKNSTLAWIAKATPLSKTWSRMRYETSPSETDDYTVDAATSFDVRKLTEVQSRFRAAMKRETLSYNRWMELIQEQYGGDGSREVDQVPIMLDQVEIGVNPREIPATDGASLGQWQSLFDFQIDHDIRGIVAPEQCILTTMLVIRFAPTVEGHHPLASTDLDYHTLIADPEMLSVRTPSNVLHKDLFISDSETVLGQLPSGWQWRADHDVVGARIDKRDSFPYSLIPNSQAETKDATRVKQAFRSQSLDDYMVDVFFREESQQPIGDSMDSYFAGMTDEVATSVGGRNQEFPKGGKNL